MKKFEKSFPNYRTRKLKCSLILLIVIISFLSFMLGFLYKSSTNNPSTWARYIIPDLNISIDYPNTWKMEHVKKLTQPENQYSYEALIEGDDGTLMLKWGYGDHGGGCDEKDIQKYTIMQTEVSVCHIQKNQSKEIWGFYLPNIIEDPLWWGSITVEMSSNNDTNEKIFRQIIESIQLN